jgi:hypothetical protein
MDGSGQEPGMKRGLDMASRKKSDGSTSRLVANACLLASAVALAPPSWAARDAGQMIAQDKANQDVIARRQAALADVASAPEADNDVLPLDHGPRATTTPWLNAQRRLHAREAAASAAAAGTK